MYSEGSLQQQVSRCRIAIGRFDETGDLMRLLWLSLVLGFTGCDGAVAPLGPVAQPNSGARASEAGTSQDLGEVSNGETIQCIFRLHNNTDKDVSVTRVKKSCACHHTTVAVGDVINPGQVLEITYSLGIARGGDVSGSLVVCTNSLVPELAISSYRLKARSPRVLWAEPGKLQLNCCDNSLKPAYFTIQSDLAGELAEGIQLTSVRGLVDMTIASRSADQIRIKILPMARLEPGHYHDLVQIVGKTGRFSVRIHVKQEAD